MNPSNKSASSRLVVVCAVASVVFFVWFAWAWQDNQRLLSQAEAQWKDGNYHQAKLTLLSVHRGVVPLDDAVLLELMERIKLSLAVEEAPDDSPPPVLNAAPQTEDDPIPSQELLDLDAEADTETPSEIEEPAATTEEVLPAAVLEPVEGETAEVAAAAVAEAVAGEALQIIEFNEHILSHGWAMVLSDPGPWVEALQNPTQEQTAEGTALLARHQLGNSLKEQWPNPAFPNELRLQLLNPSLEESELVASFNQHVLAQGWATVLTDPAPWVALLRTPTPEQQVAATALIARHKLSVDLTARWIAPTLPPQLSAELNNPQRTDTEIQAEFVLLFQTELAKKSEQLATAEWKTNTDTKAAEAAMTSAGELIVLLQKSGIAAAEVTELAKRVEGVQAEARTAFETRTARDAKLAAEAKAIATARLNPFKTQGWIIADNTAGHSGYAKKLKDPATGITFILVAPGEFQMGSSAEEVEREDDEAPHLVKIATAFYMAETEVTQAQWRKVMTSNKNPSHFLGDSLPVESVSWNDCQEFLIAAGSGYRLPTEQEWEYACRAASITPFSVGPAITNAQANLDGTIVYAAGPASAATGKTTPAGSLAPNPWGFHDMHGNVWEWCSDWYGFDASAPPDSGSERVLRGGSWITGPKYCRTANRFMENPETRNYVIGFRVAYDIP